MKGKHSNFFSTLYFVVSIIIDVIVLCFRYGQLISSLDFLTTEFVCIRPHVCTVHVYVIYYITCGCVFNMLLFPLLFVMINVWAPVCIGLSTCVNLNPPRTLSVYYFPLSFAGQQHHQQVAVWVPTVSQHHYSDVIMHSVCACVRVYSGSIQVTNEITNISLFFLLLLDRPPPAKWSPFIMRGCFVSQTVHLGLDSLAFISLLTFPEGWPVRESPLAVICVPL